MFITILEGVFALKKKEKIFITGLKQSKDSFRRKKNADFFFLDLSKSRTRTIKIILGDKNKR